MPQISLHKNVYIQEHVYIDGVMSLGLCWISMLATDTEVPRILNPKP